MTSLSPTGSPVIDLRSDTVTRPTPAMRRAMADAAVGDDVYGEDPTVRTLQERIAGLLGFEAALFMASGTQSNLCALLAHCERGDEYIVGQMAHTYRWEGGGAAVLGGIQPQPLTQRADGRIEWADIEAAIKPSDAHFARSRLLCLENTWGGHVLEPAYTVEVTARARARGLSTHLDGARLFNAAIAAGLPPGDLTRGFDSVSVCFSKGLGAPVGSALCGSGRFIERAHRWRKVTGGGMRQAGILAAAALHALDHHVQRLQQDHDHARELALALQGLAGVKVNEPQTNIVFLDLSPQCQSRHPQGVVAALAERGVLCSGQARLRLVTHMDISAEQVSSAAAILRSVLSADD